jgi:hypothetical protein
MLWMIGCAHPLDLGAQGGIGLGAGDACKVLNRMSLSRVAPTMLLLRGEDVELLSIA